MGLYLNFEGENPTYVILERLEGLGHEVTVSEIFDGLKFRIKPPYSLEFEVFPDLNGRWTAFTKSSAEMRRLQGELGNLVVKE